MARKSLLVEFWQFLREEKIWWITPIVVIFALLAVILVFAESSAIAPFIYPLF